MGMEPEEKLASHDTYMCQSPIWVWNTESKLTETSEEECINLLYGYGIVSKNKICIGNGDSISNMGMEPNYRRN